MTLDEDLWCGIRGAKQELVLRVLGDICEVPDVGLRLPPHLLSLLLSAQQAGRSSISLQPRRKLNIKNDSIVVIKILNISLTQNSES